MAPKRKRVDIEAESTAATRSTRSSARSGGTADGSNSTAKPTSSKVKSKAMSRPTPKEDTQSRASSSVSKTKKKVEQPTETETEAEDKIEPPPKKGKKVVTVSNSKLKAEASVETRTPKLSSSSKKSITTGIKHSAYVKARMEQLFIKYADEEDPSFVGGGGLEKLCTDAKISMEGAQPLLLAWLLEASELGRLTKGEWIKGLDMLQIDTLDKLRVALAEYDALLILNKPAPKPPGSHKKPSLEPYNRDSNYWRYVMDVPAAFLKFYNFVFALAKAPQERNIDIEIAKAFWVALLSHKYPIVNDLIEYINVKGTVKGVNKDLWSMTLDFSQTVKPSLENYEIDGAWPTLLDEFVTWKKAAKPSAATNNDMEG